MYARREAVRYHGKPHVVEAATGRIKRDRNNKFVKFSGLDSKVKQLRPAQDEHLLLSAHAEFLSRLPPDRNSVLHGNRAVYGSPKMSVQLLWALYVLAHMLSELLAERATVLPAPQFANSESITVYSGRMIRLN